MIDQITVELASRDFPAATVTLLKQPAEAAACGIVAAGRTGRATWVKVHQPARARDGATNDDKRGYRLKLTFSETQTGPIFLGNSCHFGLGFFVPVDL